MLSLEAGSVVGGKYRLERPLAGGAMGFLWVARHLQLDVEVALKFMMPQHADSPVARARFEREAKASAQLRTPNVVHVYDYGLEGDTPYLAMELLEGEDLAAYLARHGRLEPEELLGIVSQVCKALRRAHEVGLIHRDLKPANIFLARQGEEVVKILDFGVAKAIGTGLAADATKTGTLIGSPHYMSPEQVRRSKTIDFRSDLWSLGVIIFQCLTGQLPFPGEELGDVLVEICTGDIPVASQLAPNLWPELDRFLERALKREPAERFQSASELARAFAAAVQRTAVPDSRDSLDSTEALAHGGAPAHGVAPALGGAQAHGIAQAHGVAQALGIPPAHGVAPALGSAPAHGVAPAHGIAQALGIPPAHGVAHAHGVAPAGGGTVALDDAVTAGGTLAAGGTVVEDRTRVPGGVVGASDTLAAGGTLSASGTLEAVGGALPPPVDRRAPSRAVLAVAASVLVVGLGIAAVVLLRSPAPDATAAPAATSPPDAPASAAPPTRVEEVPAPPPASASAVPATPASSAPTSAASASAPTPSAVPPPGAVKASPRPARPQAPPPARRPSQGAPSSKGASEKDPTFGF
ncbi:Protein kinase [Sorangium cellulosum So ce56]|uniref:non-specific serine/threonine protein kinase n=1 Tax=Sorangium cellulosum (strain So ce56) TaxID=448385 RepID=A9FAC8_SORC5|nr:serine/threonine-protein kinase [Sorangium cellulosum]CAN97890.1 Protein kinase [Sorangium cellulosum So ce56]